MSAPVCTLACVSRGRQASACASTHADRRADDLRAELVLAEAEFAAAPTVDKWNELVFLRRSVKFHAGEWPGIYEQWNISKPPVEFGSAEWFAAQPEIEF